MTLGVNNNPGGNFGLKLDFWGRVAYTYLVESGKLRSL